MYLQIHLVIILPSHTGLASWQFGKHHFKKLGYYYQGKSKVAIVYKLFRK